MRKCTILQDGWYFKKGGSIPTPFRKDDPQWQEVTLPHDWAIEGPFDGWYEPCYPLDRETKSIVFAPGNASGALPYTGTGYYVHTFTLPETEKGRSFLLEFDGVMSHSTILVNDQIVGGRVYG